MNPVHRTSTNSYTSFNSSSLSLQDTTKSLPSLKSSSPTVDLQFPKMAIAGKGTLRISQASASKPSSPAPSPSPSPRHEKETPAPLNNTDWIFESRPDLDKDVRAVAKRAQSRSQQVAKGQYKFEPKDLKDIATLGIWALMKNKSHEEMFTAMHQELLKKYPGLIIKDLGQPIFNYAGTTIGKILPLHCSLHEYLIFYWTAIGNEGPSGRYPKTDIWDFIVDGKQISELESGFEANRPREAGDVNYLPRGLVNHYATPGGAYYLEYGRSDNVWTQTFNFGVISPTLSFSKDYKSMREQMGRCVEFMMGRNR